jgi:hypothetical protein
VKKLNCEFEVSTVKLEVSAEGHIVGWNVGWRVVIDAVLVEENTVALYGVSLAY